MDLNSGLQIPLVSGWRLLIWDLHIATPAPKPLGHAASRVHHYALLAIHVYMSQSKATITNKLNLQGLQSRQSVECGIWYNVDQVVVKIPVKKLYYIDTSIPKREKGAKQVLNTPSANRFHIEQPLIM